jgi:methionine-rich copper-binding protein CopC
MLKKVLTAVCFLPLFVPSFASAHSGLEQAIPGQDATVENEIKEIALTFSTKIEKGSSLELKKDGKPVDIASVNIDNKQLIAKPAQPLKNGSYTVLWEIIGADSHPVNGEYSFTVKAADTNETDDNAGDKSANEQESSDQQDKADEQAASDSDNQTSAAQTTDDTQATFSFGMIFVIVILAIIALISFGWMMKKGKE